ncbi:MAG TPA: hypothetical protein VEY07_02330 [Thermoplasmata archaeon]|nr:hypothetical protein [Thermoplasmata archaeon]
MGMGPMGGRGGRGGGLALAGLGVLLTSIEFLLGVWASLYDTVLPKSLRDVFATPYVSNDLALLAHVVLGLLLGLVALGLLLWAALRHRPRVMFSGVGALLGVLIGAGGGELFLTSGDPIYSFLMAVGFLMALGSFYGAITALRRASRWAPGAWMPGGPIGEPSPPPAGPSPPG